MGQRRRGRSRWRSCTNRSSPIFCKLNRFPKVARSSTVLTFKIGLIFRSEGCWVEDERRQLTMASIPIPFTLDGVVQVMEGVWVDKGGGAN